MIICIDERATLNVGGGKSTDKRVPEGGNEHENWTFIWQQIYAMALELDL